MIGGGQLFGTLGTRVNSRAERAGCRAPTATARGLLPLPGHLVMPLGSSFGIQLFLEGTQYVTVGKSNLCFAWLVKPVSDKKQIAEACLRRVLSDACVLLLAFGIVLLLGVMCVFGVVLLLGVAWGFLVSCCCSVSRGCLVSFCLSASCGFPMSFVARCRVGV